MEEIFKNVDPEKRDRIINSALEEFSKNRFEKASTNNIVKNAGISKGLLYHYFTSKKSLYDYLEVFAVKTMVNAISEEVDWEKKDLFIRIKQVIVIKFRVLVRYPHLVSFSKVMYEKKSIDDIKKMADKYTPDIYNEIYNRNIDFGMFKDNVDVKRAVKMTQWTLEKLSEEWLTQLKPSNRDIDYEGFIEEIDEYLKMLKESFYK